MEEFCKNHEHTIAALGVVALFLSVVTSLWIASRKNKPKILAFAEVQILDPDYPQVTLSDSNNKELKFIIRLLNVGQRPINLGNSYECPYGVIYSRLTRRVHGVSVLPEQANCLILHPTEGRTLKVNTVDSLLTFYEGAKATKQLKGFICRCLSFFHIYPSSFKLSMRTIDGSMFPVKMGKCLKKEVKKRLAEKTTKDQES